MSEKPDILDEAGDIPPDVARAVLAGTTLVYLYGLRDPNDHLFRYIGLSSDPRSRFRQHLKPSNRVNAADAKQRWIDDLRARGQSPVCVLLGYATPATADRAERDLVRSYLTAGHPLLNGQGGTVRKQDIGTRCRTTGYHPRHRPGE